MNTLIDLFLLTVIICFIIDCSGFFNFIKKFIASRLEGKYKNLKAEDIKIPFITCSLCSTWWAGLIYLIIFGKFTLGYIAFVSILSLLSSNISGFLLTIKDYLSQFECWLQKLIQN